MSVENKLPTFNELEKAFPLSSNTQKTVSSAISDITKILKGEDKRKIAIVGPCSIHNENETLIFARHLKSLAEKKKDNLLFIMRVCVDKPRTKKTWDGFMNDPDLDGSNKLSDGFKRTRKVMLEILDIGMPIATEFLYPLNFYAIHDLVSYAWVGARTVSSPEIRKISSGLGIPIGVKNNENGNTLPAIHAIDYMRYKSTFAGIDDDGILSTIKTNGNDMGHLILRGSAYGPNYSEEEVIKNSNELKDAGLIDKIIIDCSHGNSQNDYERQIDVLKNVREQMNNPQSPICGFMLESYLDAGKQTCHAIGTEGAITKITPRVSVTDACLSWEETEKIIRDLF